MELLTTTQVAARIGVLPCRVRQFIRTGRLPAMREGRDWLVRAPDVERFQRRPSGRQPRAA